MEQEIKEKGEILRLENIEKIYPNGVMANKGINFSVLEGEIHALSGENGAGKYLFMEKKKSFLPQRWRLSWESEWYINTLCWFPL